jgi:hypothetical protein
MPVPPVKAGQNARSHILLHGKPSSWIAGIQREMYRFAEKDSEENLP